jgi:integrase/recombinase XerD
MDESDRQPEDTPAQAQQVEMKQMSFLEGVPSASAQPTWQVPVVQVPEQRLTPESSVSLALHWYQQELARRGYAANTTKTYAKAAALFVRFVGKGRSLQSITPQDLKNFQAWVEEQAGRGKTAEVKLTAVKTLFRLLYEAEILPSDIAHNMYPTKAKSPLPVVLAQGQADGVRRVAAEMAVAGEDADVRPALLMTLMLDMGLRVGEAANLQVDDVDLSNPLQPVVRVRYEDPRHRAKRRSLIGPPALTELVKRQLARIPEGQSALLGVSRRWLQHLVGQIGEAAGLRRQLTTSTLRWTYIVEQRRGGTDPETLRKRLGLSALGWKDVQETLEEVCKRPV